jgi:peptidoglycan/xylan/chitin deacetylase (PgdA/CDA1 family)
MRLLRRALVLAVVALACVPLSGGSTAASHSRAVPILMYHVIAPPIAHAPFPELYVPKTEFSAEMHRLARSGYRAVTLKRVYDYWRTGRPLPPKPIVLSFDDGYRSHYTNALPVLRSLHWPGVLNLELRNERHSWGLSPAHVRALVAAGWELDSHTINHPDLTTLDPAQLRKEVVDSRRLLRSRFHVPVDFFCYPAGRYDAAVIAAVQAAGYLGGTSTRYGLARPSDLWTLARVRVNGGDGPAGLAAKLKALGS